MAQRSFSNTTVHEPKHNKTSIGRNRSLTKMNKHKRRRIGTYRGQGRV